MATETPPAATRVCFGSAHLLVGGMPVHIARSLLEAALAAGTCRLDTAPLYGHGGSEGLVAEVAAASEGVAVTTKVGLEPRPAPPRWRNAAGVAWRRLPPSLRGTVGRLMGLGHATPPQAAGPSGRFGSTAVQASVERSLGRLGAIDRLLLHEVHPADITDELLRLLDGYRARGDVVTLGVATGNAVTAASLQRADGLFTVAHVSVDPLGVPAPGRAAWPRVQFVGHGALGADGRTLAHLQAALRSDATLAACWHAATAGTPFEGADGRATALLARAALTGPGELVVSTRRIERVPRSVQAASGALPLPANALQLLERVFNANRR